MARGQLDPSLRALQPAPPQDELRELAVLKDRVATLEEKRLRKARAARRSAVDPDEPYDYLADLYDTIEQDNTFCTPAGLEGDTMHFDVSQSYLSNLGGVGPNFDDEPVLRYAAVTERVGFWNGVA